MTPFSSSLMTAGRQMQRKMRRPQHPFRLNTRPFAIMPCMIAPVLPGETMKNLKVQARVVTDPILAATIGWWQEFYFFYVKLTQLQETVAEQIPGMLMDPNFANIATITTAQGGTSSNRFTYYAGGAGMVNWVELCRRVVVRHWFRDEEDDYNTYVLDSQPMAQYMGRNVTDSYRNAAAITAVDVDVDGPDANTTVQASEMQRAWDTYQMLQMNTLQEMSWEDFLQAWGIRQPAVADEKPELLRYLRDWQYPSNTIDPTNGTPRSAVSWSIQGTADKDRLFKEPGFIVGYTVTRPKIYYQYQQGSVTSIMNDFRSWLPPWLQKNMMSSYKQTANAVGPFNSMADANGYWLDIKDLLIYGEQFTNLDRTGANANFMATPASTGAGLRYPNNLDDITDKLFVSQDDTATNVKMDGVVQLAIASRDAAVDTSPRGGQLTTFGL